MICEKKFITAKHRETNTKQRFNNLSQFRGVGKESKPDRFGGTYKNRDTGDREDSWLLKLNKKQEEKGKGQFKVKEFEIIETPEQTQELFVAKAAVNNMIDKLLLLPWVNKKKLRLVIGGCETDEDYQPNFRYEIAKSFPYKDGRKGKPILFYELREWFVQKYKDNVVIAQGCEADDMLCIFSNWANKQNISCVLCFIDKDIEQTENCWHYNYQKLKEMSPKTLKDNFSYYESLGLTTPTFIDKFEANRNLWRQIITGDFNVDNIPGLIGVGEVEANKLIDPCKTEKEMIDVVIERYKEYAKDEDLFVKKGYNKYLDYKTVLNEQFSLIKMMDEKDVIPDFNVYKGNIKSGGLL